MCLYVPVKPPLASFITFQLGWVWMKKKLSGMCAKVHLVDICDYSWTTMRTNACLWLTKTLCHPLSSFFLVRRLFVCVHHKVPFDYFVLDPAGFNVVCVLIGVMLIDSLCPCGLTSARIHAGRCWTVYGNNLHATHMVSGASRIRWPHVGVNGRPAGSHTDANDGL